MIKRLKWNVLYGSDDSGPEGDSSDDSDDEYEKAAEALAQLKKNDPAFNLPLQTNDDDDGDDFVRKEFSEEEPAVDEEEKEEGNVQESERPEFIEWKECDLCPGKRFLSDNEVERHLASKRHHYALKKYERAVKEKSELTLDVDEAEPMLSKSERRKQQRKKRLKEISSGNNTKSNCNINGVEKENTNATELKQVETEMNVMEKKPNDAIPDSAAVERKKKAMKRKLKKLKERKWRAAQEKKAAESGASPAEETLENKEAPVNKQINGATKKDDASREMLRNGKSMEKSNLLQKRKHGGVTPGGKKKRKKRALDLQ